ncbi:MAG: hypothetical protein J7L94_03770 [Caldisericaceae bacterium]|nr:hypothetical protein [Caldisericaceae bacterium]
MPIDVRRYSNCFGRYHFYQGTLFFPPCEGTVQMMRTVAAILKVFSVGTVIAWTFMAIVLEVLFSLPGQYLFSYVLTGDLASILNGKSVNFVGHCIRGQHLQNLSGFLYKIGRIATNSCPTVFVECYPLCRDLCFIGYYGRMDLIFVGPIIGVSMAVESEVKAFRQNDFFIRTYWLCTAYCTHFMLHGKRNSWIVII